MGIPYADHNPRFEHSQRFSKTGQSISAIEAGDFCAQSGSGSETCQFLNIQTPYIPWENSTSDLRPVLFWIHGGAFTVGSGTDPDFDGGNLASREDIVVVTINYRLGTRFLAVPNTNITGNYGIGDQVTALQVSQCPIKYSS
jgi:carboxylesterase type B